MVYFVAPAISYIGNNDGIYCYFICNCMDRSV